MAIRKPARKSTADEARIDRIIDGGGAPPQSVAKADPDLAVDKPVKFQMSIDPELCSLIDEARSISRTSRRAWLIEAAAERLRREGRLS